MGSLVPASPFTENQQTRTEAPESISDQNPGLYPSIANEHKSVQVQNQPADGQIIKI